MSAIRELLVRRCEPDTYLLRLTPSPRYVKACQELERLAALFPEREAQIYRSINELGVTVSHSISAQGSGFSATKEPGAEMQALIKQLQRLEEDIANGKIANNG